MQVVQKACAGLDVHQKTVVACAREQGRAGGENLRDDNPGAPGAMRLALRTRRHACGHGVDGWSSPRFVDTPRSTELCEE